MTQLSFLARDERSAVISPCGQYRYRLGRRWGDGPTMLWICLNPSIADAEIDDPSVRRMIGFAKSWGFGGFDLGNIFALRSTDPKALYSAADPIGPDNDDHLKAMASGASLVVAGWGAHGNLVDRGDSVKRMIPGMKVLGLTKAGEPLHPLYLPKDLKPIDF